jgi:hypothetical protein
MKLKFGNLEDILCIKNLRIDSISDELHQINMEWHAFGNKEILGQKKTTLEFELNQLSIECQNLRDEINYKSGQEIIPLQFECVEMQCFNPDMYYPH